ncbi:sensor histidine kinase [Polymorphum gilvum]|uniref:histidine kinase n=1 Tax=Polymorphum gilvum (strain LMG 25793 / CGMCC 1.9160 / SL003B-26A1) TaxID=991905 RepID=F2J6E9_POLGS|nr:ATP-binding protein [Polymorphum gilvum]ADZ71323.1 ATPase, histidine kinase-, DNA gyrase B-, and HSP90-like domain protein [Polymorphum gilvum SL003B-26A1]
MTPLSRLIRTTAFKLSVLYLAVFTALSGFLLVYISRNINALMADQVVQTVDAEIDGLADQYARGGVRALVAAIDSRSRRPDASLYLFVDFAGNAIAGNISRLPTTVLEEADGGVRRVKYARREADGEPAGESEREAIVRTFELPGGFRLLVGRDLGEQLRFRDILSGALRLWLGVVVAMAVVTWLFVSRRVLKRIDAMAATSRRIMEGNLSERLPLAGNGDEFDRLAVSLNGMLERIELLMHGLRDVTDNIAHDLKTPLTRLRTRVEAALREARGEADYREALEATIEESEGLIRIFDALLRIARVEAMSPEEDMAPVDVGAIAREMAELYAPLAEEGGGALTVEADDSCLALGNRDLIAQALVNLIENALKYGLPADGQPPAITVKLRRDRERIRLSVEDNGPGIGAQDRDRVLDRFVRLEASRSEPGYGLGLSLVRAIARLHGGTLVLEDAGPGLAARIDLMAAPADRLGGETGNAGDTGRA